MRECAWCHGPIPPSARRDALCCSVRCRQARHRFTTGVGQAKPSRDAGAPLRLAYADPPYPGKSKRYYGDHPDYAGEVDHASLVASLVANYDGWALSTSAAALRDVLILCPPNARVAAWVRGARLGRSLTPNNSWEPVIYCGGRELAPWRDAAVLDDASRSPGEQDVSRIQPTRSPSTPDASILEERRIDSLVYHAAPRRTDPNRVIGAKPAVFCRWIFDLLGAQPGDEFVDVFPGSGGVGRAWDVFTR